MVHITCLSQKRKKYDRLKSGRETWSRLWGEIFCLYLSYIWEGANFFLLFWIEVKWVGFLTVRQCCLMHILKGCGVIMMPDHFLLIHFKSKININKYCLVNFTVYNQAIPEIFKVLSSKNNNGQCFQPPKFRASFKFMVESTFRLMNWTAWYRTVP